MKTAITTRRVAILAVVALVALVHVPFPFWGDQALFTYAAHAMRHGDRLYVDLWDYKQPGIFLWYLGAGSLFGFHEAGIHVAELLWSVALAVSIQKMMRTRVEHAWVADVAPLLTVGAFYAAANGWDLAQIEYLVALPLLLSLWAAADAEADGCGERARTRLLVLSGVMASVVVYFKLVYVLIPLGFWLYLLVSRRRRDNAHTARDVATLAGGLLAPLVPLLVYFVHEHLLGTMWWTYVTYPPKIVRSIDPPPFSRLRDGVHFFVRNFAWLAVLATAAWLWRKRGGARRDPLMVGLAIWFVVGWGTLLIQNQWGYQFMLPLIPLGLFAVYGVDRLCTRIRETGLKTATVGLMVVAALVAAFPAKEAVHAVKTLAQDHFTLTTSGRHEYEATFSPYYPDARAAVAFLNEPGRTPGAIHVEGNPLIQYLSGRPYALREHGWAPEQSDARLWEWTRDGLRDKRPVYLWVDEFSLGIMRARSRETLALVDSMYCPVQRIADGTWYALQGSRECSAN